MAEMRRLAATPLLTVAALVVLAALAWPNPVTGVILPPPPPLGVLVVVNTPSDLEDPGDGTCSLRGAIFASNINGIDGGCDASLSQAGATDGIIFDIGTGTPTINISSTLPAITDRVSINGAGPATRVELHGPGVGVGGLSVDTAAAGSSIRNLVINGFGGGGISLGHTSNITITGNFIGTDATGTAAAAANRIGIQVFDTSAQIGGLSGLTPGGPCTGDCNVISGNSEGVEYVDNGGRGVIEGNFIGTDATGMFAIGNTDGISLASSSSPTVGGTAAGAGNLISGNGDGINMKTAAPLVEGNLIGTNIKGSGAIPNQTGIYVNRINTDPFTVGGSAAGAGNVISGNTAAGVSLGETDNITLYGNLIGTQLDGTSALANGGAGVELAGADDVIGGVAPGQANTIAFNGGYGVDIPGTYSNEVRGNSIHDNSGKGIHLADNQRNTTSTPAITGVNPVTGTACANCIVDVYSDSADEGKIYEGAVTADAGGGWTFNGPVAGPNVTATATNVLSTSEFSAPVALPATPTPSPTPTLAPTPTATATNTATPTPTATPTSHPSPTVLPSGSAQYRGDADCNGHVDVHDVLATLSALERVPPGAACAALAEVDCDNELAADDALRILDFVAGDPLAQPTNCLGVGTLT